MSLDLDIETDAEIERPPGKVVKYAPPKPDHDIESEEAKGGSFPIDCFPPMLRDTATNLAVVYQTPVSLPAMAALAVLSGAIGPSVTVRGGFKDKATRLNLYVIGMAERGTGKGATSEILAKPLAEKSRVLAEQHRKFASDRKAELGILKREINLLTQKIEKSSGVDRDSIIDTLKNRQREADELEIEASREVTLWVSDCTSQKLARALADNSETLLSYSSEAGGVLKVVLGRYNDGQGDFDFYLSAYSGDAIRVDRIGRPSLELQRPCLSLLWLVQGSVLTKLLSDEEAFSRGLTARPLIFDSGAIREHDDRQNNEFRFESQWRELVNSFLDQRLLGAAPIELGCTSDAREAFACFNDEGVDLERGPFADLTGELSRWRENAIKVAGIFARAEGQNVISKEIALRAIRVVRWCGLNYLEILKVGRRERLAEKLESVTEIIKAQGGEISLGDLVRSHGIKRQQIDALSAVFPGRLTLEKIPRVSGPGRPAEILKLGTISTKSN